MKKSDYMAKTHAKTFFCLSDADLSQLVPVEKRNPFSKNAAPMKLYLKKELQALAEKKYGSTTGFEAEREQRAVKRAKRSDARQGSSHLPATGQPSSVSISGQWSELHLPDLITERIRVCHKHGNQEPSGPLTTLTRGSYVLYWMKTAVRGHENPAMDVARAQARAAGLPLLVAAFVLLQHPHQNERRFKFLMEGLRDAQIELSQQGIPLLVHLDGHLVMSPTGSDVALCGWPALLQLAADSSLVVTEEMPVAPDAEWLERLRAQLPQEVAVWAVDTSCIVPMHLTKKGYERAGPYRAATEALRKERCRAVYAWGDAATRADGSAGQQAADTNAASALVEGLSWRPVDLACTDISELLSGWPGLDRSVRGVQHMVGGSSAGYARWEDFRRSRLMLYAAQRNDALIRGGSSRMSAYHHWGMVSPFRVSREAAAQSNSGAHKFLDEFLVWREVAHSFCFHRYPEIDSISVLPAWAQQTLMAHAQDTRPALMTVEQLEEGTTGDAFWDAAQHQLATTGELHNNVRMTWGKALLQWTASPAEALSTALRLNHRYALDGCDPASYGGVLWCFGLFDAPKEAKATPVSGSLCRRSTLGHARRLPPDAYRRLPV